MNEEIPLSATDLREVVYGPVMGYVISTNAPHDLVEIWIDPAEQSPSAMAVANLRLEPEDAVKLAQELISSASALVDLESSASRQHYIDTGRYIRRTEEEN